MKIAIGCDHGAFALKTKIIGHLRQQGHEVEDFGTCSTASSDYPDFADKIYNYYMSLDEKSFSENCDAALRKILEEYNDAANAVKEACR